MATQNHSGDAPLQRELKAWVPPTCLEACVHGWPGTGAVFCHCPQLVARFGLQPVGVMRSNDHACGQAIHLTKPHSYTLN